MYGLWENLYQLSEDLSKMSASMLPNISQLAGAILTLATALLASLGLFDETLLKYVQYPIRRLFTWRLKNLHEKIFNYKEYKNSRINNMKFLLNGKVGSFEWYEYSSKQMLKMGADKQLEPLRKSIRELSYGITGIILIICGYIFAVIGLDYQANFIFYFIPHIIIFLLIELYSIYNVIDFIRFSFRIKGNGILDIVFTILYLILYLSIFLILFPWLLLLFIHLMSVFKMIGIIVAFLGSTISLMLLVIILIESILIKIVIKLTANKVKKIHNKMEKHETKWENDPRFIAEQIEKEKRRFKEEVGHLRKEVEYLKEEIKGINNKSNTEKQDKTKKRRRKMKRRKIGQQY